MTAFRLIAMALSVVLSCFPRYRCRKVSIDTSLGSREQGEYISEWVDFAPERRYCCKRGNYLVYCALSLVIPLLNVGGMIMQEYLEI